MNYEEMSEEHLNALNDDLGRQIAVLKDQRQQLKVVLNKKLRQKQVLARYGNKIKPEDIEFLKAQGAIKDSSQVLTPGVAEASSAAAL